MITNEEAIRELLLKYKERRPSLPPTDPETERIRALSLDFSDRLLEDRDYFVASMSVITELMVDMPIDILMTLNTCVMKTKIEREEERRFMSKATRH